MDWGEFFLCFLLFILWPGSCAMEDYFKHQEKMTCLEQHMTADQCEKWRNQ